MIFSEPIVPSTFTYQNLTYSKPGEPNLITPSITITQLSPTEFAISNFNNLLLPHRRDLHVHDQRGRRRRPVRQHGNRQRFGYLDADHDGADGPDRPGDLAEHRRHSPA